MFGSCENRAIHDGCEVWLKYQYQYFHFMSVHIEVILDLKVSSTSRASLSPLFFIEEQTSMHAPQGAQNWSKKYLFNALKPHPHQARCKLAWKCRDVQIFPFSGFNCIVLSSVFKRNTFFWPQIQFPQGAVMWFTLYQWRARKHWLSMWCTFVPHMLELFMTSDTDCQTNGNAHSCVFATFNHRLLIFLN